jgi:hypothetical protein
MSARKQDEGIDVGQCSNVKVDFRQSRTLINSDTYSLLPIGVRFRGQSGHTPDIADASKTAAEAALIPFGQSS